MNPNVSAFLESIAMRIEICPGGPGQPCRVQLGKWQVPFCDEAHAVIFVNLLQQRINAPHRLPGAPDVWQLPEQGAGEAA